MNGTFLEKITTRTRQKLSRIDSDRYLPAMKKKAEAVRRDSSPNSFRRAISKTGETNIIAEIKRASPSKGAIMPDLDVALQAKRYERGRAAAVSVLTEPDHFDGSVRDLISVRQAVDLPLLRKDFIVDKFQIYEAAAAGADAVLLIAAALSRDEINSLRRVVEDELKMDALVEVHDAVELTRAVDAGARLIGVNNRDLHSLDVSLDVSRGLAAQKPANAVLVAESGLTSRAEIDELRQCGFDAFLIGETLMRAADPVAKLEELGA